MIRLSDVFIPSVYGSYTAVNNPMNSQLVATGIIATNDLMNTIARSANKVATVPFWRDIDPSIEPNYSNDDPADLAVANKIGSGSMTARKVFLNQSFGSMDLVAELSGSSPLQHVRNRFGTYWQRQMERRLIATCVGLMADNIANDGGDMVIDISGLVGDAAKFNASSFIDAAFTMGDQVESIKAIAVHSVIAARMTKNEELADVLNSKGELLYRTYKGRVVIIDDNLPVSGAGVDRIFTSILFGVGAVGMGGVEGHAFAAGEGVPQVPAWVERTEQAGNGGGMEQIGERKTWLIHPHGFEWIEGSLVEFSPTLADLRLAAHWNRVVDRKQIPLAFIKSKG